MKTTTGIVTSILLAAALALTGCSPTGWASKPMPDASSFEPGQNITIQQKDGSVTSGMYLGNAELDQQAYDAIYNETIFHKGLDNLLPCIGEQVEVTTRLAENRIISGRLIGFDEVNLWLQPSGQSGPERVYVAAITGFSHSSGQYLGRREFRALFLDGSIPLRSTIVLRSNGNDVQILVNNIQSVTESGAPQSAVGSAASVAAFTE